MPVSYLAHSRLGFRLGLWCLPLLLCLGLCSRSRGDSPPPNVIFILADDKGNTVATVWHNGVKVHEDFLLHKDAPKPSPILLQNHGNPVVYRSIWFVESR